jgi:phenylalanyl-tRNA synthetase beta chain
MKFSFTLLKKLVPAVKNKKDLINKLNLHFFEAEDAAGDVLDVSIPPNRFSDAASHFGIGREIAAILGVRYKEVLLPKYKEARLPKIKIVVEDKNLCPRYTAQYFENIKIGPSPKWMQKILIDCGLRPINNVVDIMNYAMLETGQPLHAFDYDKITNIVVRRAKKGEKITTLEDKTYELNENILVIATSESLRQSASSPRQSAALAIAGIKGGKKAEVDKNTKRIVVEAANFNGVNIYKSSKTLKLSTDASLRFSHNISPELTIIGINRANKLLQEVIGAKTTRPVIDVNYTQPRKKIIKFNLEKFNKFIGTDLDIRTCQKYLQRLGFKITPIPRGLDQRALRRSLADQPESATGPRKSALSPHKSALLVEVPPLRRDIEIFEDLTEEIIRLYGFNRLKSISPHLHLHPSGFEDRIVLKDKIRKVLAAAGLSEVYNYSFISESDLTFGSGWKDEVIELENPISNQLKYLRPSLAPYLVKNINSNFRFFDEVRIFEIGKIFYRISEKLTLGIALASKKDKQVFFELKGIIEQLFKKVGLVSYLMPEPGEEDWIKVFTNNFLISGEILKIESDGETIGYLGRINKELVSNYEGVLVEIDLDALLKLVEEEHEYLPLPKYPSVMRDISILIAPTIRVAEIMQAIQEVDLKYIEDVDLIDEYDLQESEKRKVESKKTRSLTFRIIFQAEDRTLTDKEVNKEMEKITKMLKSKFRAIIR